MKTLSDQALLDAYKKAKLLNLSSEFILLIEEELKKRKLGSTR
ncbi:sporulation histidine kinase inhibitor Sda [Bacillus sp. JRC01]|nr:sporulation histidine kinase inhibitor Sda [Bacillus sp. JRC01]